jgi:hypothetical protein
MRHAAAVCILASALAGLSIGALPANADWLVLKGGKKIQTDGVWVLKGDLLTVHDLNGRIISISTTIVDSAACLRLNGNKLNIHEIKVTRPQGAAPVAPSPLLARATPNPALPRSASMPSVAAPGLPPPAAAAARVSSTRPAATNAGGAAKPATATPAATTTATTPATATATAAAVTNTTGAAITTDEELKARKMAAQARLRREAADRRIVDDCALLYPLDQAAFQSCVATQRRAAATPPASAN